MRLPLSFGDGVASGHSRPVAYPNTSAVAPLNAPASIIIVDEQVIGGIDAGFDTSEHDAEIAQAGLVALSR
jgi:uncharacterized protein GlcG (DUF336 family)